MTRIVICYRYQIQLFFFNCLRYDTWYHGYLSTRRKTRVHMKICLYHGSIPIEYNNPAVSKGDLLVFNRHTPSCSALTMVSCGYLWSLHKTIAFIPEIAATATIFTCDCTVTQIEEGLACDMTSLRRSPLQP